MATQLDLTEGAFANRLTKDVLSNFSLVMTQFYFSCLLVGHDANLIRITDSLVNGGCRRLFLTLRRESMARNDSLPTLQEVHEVAIWTLHLLRLVSVHMAASVGE